MTQSIPETNSAQSELIGITNLDQFVTMLSMWHQNRVAQMQKLMEIPEDVQVTTDEAEPVTLTGDVRVGFMIGITTGLAILGKLPFVAELDSEVVSNA